MFNSGLIPTPKILISSLMEDYAKFSDADSIPDLVIY